MAMKEKNLTKFNFIQQSLFKNMIAILIALTIRIIGSYMFQPLWVSDDVKFVVVLEICLVRLPFWWYVCLFNAHYIFDTYFRSPLSKRFDPKFKLRFFGSDEVHQRGQISKP